MSDAGARHGKNRNIQFLRGLAIVLVLLAHGSVMLIGAEAVWWDRVLQRFLPGVGVDLFFLISGFLMGATFLRKHRQFDAAAVYGFYKKRIRRVLLPTGSGPRWYCCSPCSSRHAAHPAIRWTPCWA